jgi:hypothetical protein
MVVLPGCSLVTSTDGLSGGASPERRDESPAAPVASVRDASTDATHVFSDEFASPKLAAGWTFTDPIGDSTYSLIEAPGRLVIKTPGSAPHDCYTTAGCPRMMRPVADDRPRTFLVDVQNSPTKLVETYGLLLWQDASKTATAVGTGHALRRHLGAGRGHRPRRPFDGAG